MRASRLRLAGSAAAVWLAAMAVAFGSMWSGDGIMVTTEAEESEPDAPSRPAGLAAPTDGVASRLLPVFVEPSTQLSHGQVVGISGSGFTPGATLGAVLCSAGAAGGGGVAFCELAHYDNFEASSEGTFADDYVLRRFIVTPAEGTVDCGESTDRCLLAVGNINDYDESGGSFISHQGASDPPPPELVVSPSHGLADGQVISVKGTGVRAAPDARLRLCPAGREETPETCTPLVGQPDGPGVGGQLSVTVQVGRFLGSEEGRIDCAAPPGCVLTTTEYAGRLAVVPIGFDPSAGASPEAPPPPPTVTETTVLPAAPPTTVEPDVTTTVPEPTTTVAPDVTTTVPEPTTTVAPGPGGATGPLSDLDLRLELDDTTLSPGAATGGAIVIENNTQRTIVDPSCTLVNISFGLVPTSEPDAPEQGGSTVETECEPGGFPMPPGFTVRSDLPAPFTARHGVDDGPLRPGDYLAVVRFDRVLEPLSVPVTVTP